MSIKNAVIIGWGTLIIIEIAVLGCGWSWFTNYVGAKESYAGLATLAINLLKIIYALLALKLIWVTYKKLRYEIVVQTKRLKEKVV